MIELAQDCITSKSFNESEALFASIADNLEKKGYSVQPMKLPKELGNALLEHLGKMDKQLFNPAGIGRKQGHTLNHFVRKDEICWINGESEAGLMWLNWAQQLQEFLNRQLFLGLFSFESHFAHYEPGAFYKKHLDSFKGEANRVLSMVVYLNPGWLPEDGGELVFYPPGQLEDGQNCLLKVTPAMGTVVTFLSEDFPHEVLPTKRDRYSIAAWYRVNTSLNKKIDPPR